MDAPADTLFAALLAATRRHGRQGRGQWRDMKPSALSYGDLLKMSLALGRLACKVTEPGERVGILLPNIAATPCLVFGLTAFGRVACLLNYTAGLEGMRGACQVAGIRRIIASREFLAKAGLQAQGQALAETLEVIYLEDLRARFTLADKLWLLGRALPFPARAVPPGDPEATAVVLFTSGSEGHPKGVALSHRALLTNVEQVLAVLHFGPENRVLTALPLFHAFAFTAGVLLPLVSGARLILYPSPLHYKTIPRLVREQGCDILFGSGTFLRHYALNAEPGDFAGLRLVVAGAEKLGESVRRLWRERFGLDIVEGYGCTEMAPVVSANTREDNRHGTVGRLLPGIEARLLPVAGIAEGGELHLRGPNLMSGYFLPERPGVLVPPASAVGPGWHNTGDVVSIDGQGFLRVVARVKRFAKVAGEMVSLEVAEEIARLASAEGVHAATSVDDPQRGECIVLFTTDSALTRECLLAAARGQGYPELAVPRRVRCLDSLPVLGSGKVDYVRLRRLAEAV